MEAIMGKIDGAAHGKTASPRYPKNLEELKELWGVDTLPGSKTPQEILLKWVQQKVQEDGGLEYILENKDFLLAGLADAKKHTLFSEDLDEIAKRTVFNGFIQVFNLAYILGEEEQYKGVLPLLWELSGCDLHRGEKIKTDTWNGRTRIWYRLLRRSGRVGVHRANPSWRKWSPIRQLNLYDPDTRQLKALAVCGKTLFFKNNFAESW